MNATSLETAISSLDIEAPDGTCDCKLALPTGQGRYPGILFFMDAFGLRPVIDAWIERIAGQGYVVLAPNLLYRSARSPIVEDVRAMTTEENRPKLFGMLMPMMGLLTPENAARDAGVYVDYLTGLPGVGPGPIGVTGYCMGGTMAFRTGAARPDRVRAIASFHGGNLASEKEDSPHLSVGRFGAEVYVGHADHDQSMPPEQQACLDAALSGAGLRFKTEVYADAPHGYTMADTAAYREPAAEKHFQELIALFDRTLKVG